MGLIACDLNGIYDVHHQRASDLAILLCSTCLCSCGQRASKVIDHLIHHRFTMHVSHAQISPSGHINVVFELSGQLVAASKSSNAKSCN